MPDCATEETPMSAITSPTTTNPVTSSRAAVVDRSAGFATTVSTVATRTVRKYVRSPQLMVMSLTAGAIFMLLFRYIFGGAIDLGSVAYVDFLVPGMVLTWVLIAGVGTATGIAEDVDQGFFDRLRSLPVPRLALVAGRVVGDTIILAGSTLITAAMGFLVGFRLHGDAGEALLGYALCLVCGFAFLWMFVWMGHVAGNAQAAQGMTMLIYPIIFVSSAYVRVDTLPGWMQPIAENSPVTVMSNAVRSLALGDPALAGLDHTTGYWIGLSLMWAAGIIAVFAPLASAAYRRSS
jgi:ABC-2 type transport system permease protein